MAYCVIDVYPVLLTRSRVGQLIEEGKKVTRAETDWKTASLNTPWRKWRSGSTVCYGPSLIPGEGGMAAGQPIYNLLMTYHKESVRRFGREWVLFNFEGNEARDVIYDVLEAYCDWSGHGSVRYKRWTHTEAMAIENGEALAKPGGTVYELRHTVRLKHMWWKYRHGMQDRTFILNIDDSRVQRIFGALHRFYIVYGELVIDFAEEDIVIGSFVPDILSWDLSDRKPRLYGRRVHTTHSPTGGRWPR